MNSESIKEKLAKKNGMLSIMNCDFKKNSSVVGKEKSQRKISVTMRPGTAYQQCFSGGNFASQYEDECPVNYSLKYSETESCKCINKCDAIKKKFKDYTDYAETDLDQPTDFSLKYAEKTCDDENKTIPFNYYNSDKVKFKEYTDYVETDLDQPTDFTLKYREAAEEDAFYESEERKPPNPFPCERLPSRFASQEETPLMFSRSSSLNSLSSFVHLIQSIPDDRSSVVSDFSRMTSGIISPSELPDSPTQTAPSSPKRVKPAVAAFPSKQSVFEDDVATYKQEDTPIEFSRATSLSSLNIESSKPEMVVKQTLGAPIDMSKEDNQSGEELVQPESAKQDVPERDKAEQDKGKFELSSVLEVDESLFADCINIDIQINCRKPKATPGRLMVPAEGTAPFRQNNPFHLKPNCRLRFQNESRKAYGAYELSDDAVHTYHTEGTPANVSHAGSHSDLSALSIASGVALSGAEDNPDGFFPESNNNMSSKTKTDPLRNNMKACDGSDAGGRNATEGALLDYPGKDDLPGKDEARSFALEGGGCQFLHDLTVNVINSPLEMTRAENFEEASSQMLSPLRNVSPQSPNSIVFEEADDALSHATSSPPSLSHSPEKSPEEFGKQGAETWHQSSGAPQAEPPPPRCPPGIDLESNLPLTAFEEALLEECIRLGMPGRAREEELDEEGDAGGDVGGACGGTSSPNSVQGENFDLESSSPLTAFEEVLLEQCIQMGMPQRRKQEGAHLKGLDEGAGDFECEFPGLITPLESALVEQCIRLGMPQKKPPRRDTEESHKAVPCLAAHLSRLRLGPEGDRERDSPKKCESCPCGRRHAYRRRNAPCRRSKGRADQLKVESCPV